VTTLEDIEATLVNHIERCHEELDKAELMLHVLRHGPSPDQPDLFTQGARPSAQRTRKG
jgi:hypothetical protein